MITTMKMTNVIKQRRYLRKNNNTRYNIMSSLHVHFVHLHEESSKTRNYGSRCVRTKRD